MSKKTEPIPFFIQIPGIGKKFAAWLKVIVFGTLALMYAFWATDVLPDTLIGGIGYIDDAIIFFAAAWAVRGAVKTILDQKSTLMRGLRK